MLLARQATGSLRDAISLLDQLSSAGKQITLEYAHAILGTAASQAVIDIVEALIGREPSAGLNLIHSALDSGADPRQFARQIVDYLRGLLLIRMKNADQLEATSETRAQMARQAHEFQTPELLRIIQAFNKAALEARLSWQPAMPLELAFIEVLEGVPEDQPAPAKPDREVRESPSRPMKTVTHKKETVKAATRSAEENTGPVSEASSASLEGITFEAINQRWSQVLTAVRQRNPQTQGLLNSCRPLGIKDGQLVLGFNSDFSKAKMEKSDHTEITIEVLKQVFGVDVPIRLMVSAGKRGSSPPNIESDGIVATALRDLDGEIVDIQ
jgi:DNA polymerase III subunit gamma/tau